MLILYLSDIEIEFQPSVLCGEKKKPRNICSSISHDTLESKCFGTLVFPRYRNWK